LNNFIRSLITIIHTFYNKNDNNSRIIQGYLSLFPWIIFCNKHSSSMFDREILLSNSMKYINNKEGELDGYVIACNVRQRCITNHAYPIIPAVLVAQMVVVSCNKIFGKNTLNAVVTSAVLRYHFFAIGHNLENGSSKHVKLSFCMPYAQLVILVIMGWYKRYWK